MPDATPAAPPDDGPAQTSTTDQTVSQVAVLSLDDSTHEMANVYLILEKAGSAYVVTFYDTTSNTYYTATDTADTVFAVPATSDLDAVMAQYGVSGSLATLMFVNADTNMMADPPTTAAGWPPAADPVQVAQVPGARLLPAVPVGGQQGTGVITGPVIILNPQPLPGVMPPSNPPPPTVYVPPPGYTPPPRVYYPTPVNRYIGNPAPPPGPFQRVFPRLGITGGGTGIGGGIFVRW